MEFNFNQNISSLQQILNSSCFAQFLSEHLARNNVSQSEISNLLYIFSNQLNSQQHQSISRNDSNGNNNNSFHDLGISHISIISNNHSIISDSHILSDISETTIMNDGAAPGINNFSTKEYENGTYEGSIINNKREGKGIMRYKSGDIYEGYYKNDKKDGKGIYTSIDGYKYEGYFKEGLREGMGDIVYKSGDRYNGEWIGDKYNGKGT